MSARPAFILLCALVLNACAPDAASTDREPRRIISLDFCADQYLLAFADRDQIVALSPDAEKSFSYFRDRAHGIRQTPARTEDILIQKPDAVIRTYGGGPNITAFMERVGVDVIQIAYANDLAAIRQNVVDTAAALGASDRGAAIIADMDKRLADVNANAGGDILYMTSKGAVAGTDTLMDELITRAGRTNFVQTAGWRMAPLEQLAYAAPDAVAAGFFDGSDARTDLWSAARHPVARRAMRNSDVIDIPGDWTACSAWFVVDAVEAMAAAQ